MAFEIILGIAVLVLIAVIYFLVKLNSSLRRGLKELVSSKQSLATKYGKMSEQFMPFLKTYPYDSQNFRFLGTPIDGVQFENDKIVFVEFKTGDSRLSAKQKNIKELVDKKKVKWEEVRISPE